MENNFNIDSLISELVSYGISKGLIDEEDKIYTTNRLLELFEKNDFEDTDSKEKNDYIKESESKNARELHFILEDMTEYAIASGLLKESTITARDLFDTKIMGCITPLPSIVREKFKKEYEVSPVKATDYFYNFSKATNYIREDRIIKDKKWVTNTEYGMIDITINLSKPEKDPKDIARAATLSKSGYPACLLCKENEGYAGHFNHPARQNHRVIKLNLDGANYYMQYSPYVYYNEHCILFNEEHVPMKIDRSTFRKLLDFVRQYPHYMAGSNADLPIVGGSILSHDHFQGGRYTFAMAKADYEYTFELNNFREVKAGIVKWPMSVIRLRSNDLDKLSDAADYVLKNWREYTDEDAFIFCETNGEKHSTITPIARMHGDEFEIDLVLRNNITTSECPWGVYHPTADLHHIKKENIGLIEVMGLAVLPARLKNEMELLKKAILEGDNIRENDIIAKHADWVDEWICNYDLKEDNIDKIIQDEISKVFVKVLECAGVYKRDESGKAAFRRFVKSLGVTNEYEIISE